MHKTETKRNVRPQINYLSYKAVAINFHTCNWVGICGTYSMANDNPVRFTLSDDTRVIIKKVKNNKYDFELTLSNGNRKTFMWSTNEVNELSDRHGNIDERITEAVQQFLGTLNA
jgi:hypothetical protein